MSKIIDDFKPFKSDYHKLVFYLTKLDGLTRYYFLGLTSEHELNKNLLDKWYNEKMNILDNNIILDNIEIHSIATDNLKAIYKHILDINNHQPKL